jgi:hypothetical protein
MPGDRKLQVFVSSTYTDLQDERQAAVQAILTAKHIPAGMELFAAGDKSQMEVIRRWIDQSDVFLLILGGRYGSIEKESGKSYTQLEYEYALEKGKPFFAVIIKEEHLEERVKAHGTTMLERDEPGKLKLFRELAVSKTCRFWSDCKDIKIAILETLNEYSARPDVVGWVRADTGMVDQKLVDEMAQLSDDNRALREENSLLRASQRELLTTPAELVAECYALLEAELDAARQYTSIIEFAKGPTKEERRQKLTKHLERFNEVFRKSKLRIPEEIAKQMEAIDRRIWELSRQFMSNVEFAEANREAVSPWGDIWQELGEGVGKQLSHLEKMCRDLLGT